MSSGAWYTKYKPVKLSEVILPENAPKNKIQSFYDNAFVDGNLLCHGPTGTGKTSLNGVLGAKIIKERPNLLKIGRTVDDIDNLARELRYQVHGEDKQRVILIEEMDILSPQAQTALKVELMEKYQHTTTFLATTNHLEKIDEALLSRFNTRVDFGENPNKKDVFDRLKYILEAEKITFKEEELAQYVTTNLDIGLRNMINELELFSDSGTFKPTYRHLELTSAVTSTKVSHKEISSETKRIWDIHGRSILSKDELATELNICPKTVDRRIKEGRGLPRYKKDGTNHIGFPIREVARYLVSDLTL